jgi:hypothetical protein
MFIFYLFHTLISKIDIDINVGNIVHSITSIRNLMSFVIQLNTNNIHLISTNKMFNVY